MAAMRHVQEDDLRAQIHNTRDEWHNFCHVERCLGPVMNNYIEKLIDMTEEMDEIKENEGEQIELEY